MRCSISINICNLNNVTHLWNDKNERTNLNAWDRFVCIDYNRLAMEVEAREEEAMEIAVSNYYFFILRLVLQLYWNLFGATHSDLSFLWY